MSETIKGNFESAARLPLNVARQIAKVAIDILMFDYPPGQGQENSQEESLQDTYLEPECMGVRRRLQQQTILSNERRPPQYI